MYQPLADLLRPTSLDEVYGQEHILGEGAILRRLIESGKVPNIVVYAPSGTGKTVQYAQRQGKPIVIINPKTQRVEKED